MRFRTVMAEAVLLSLLGCASGGPPEPDRPVRYIQIRDTVEPQVLYVTVGDEVRWQNLRSEPVRINLLGSEDWTSPGCGKGFSWLGIAREFITIEPREYVSLCVSRPRTLRFNVWMNAGDLRGQISPTATIRVMEKRNDSGGPG
ncbi:MAG: hypothetical protein NW703_07020 [Nitrospiraceae bacterium]